MNENCLFVVVVVVPIRLQWCINVRCVVGAFEILKEEGVHCIRLARHSNRSHVINIVNRFMLFANNI